VTPKELDAICKVLRKNGVKRYAWTEPRGDLANGCADFPHSLEFGDAAPLGAVPRQRMPIDPDDLDGGPLPAEPGDEDGDPTVPPT
jgi:hypothetical protein